jgi:hypothetical protein
VVDLFLVVSDGGIEVVLTVIAFGTTTLQPPHHHPFLWNIIQGSSNIEDRVQCIKEA